MALGEQLVEVPVGMGEERVYIADSDPAADPVHFVTPAAGGTRVEIVQNPGLADRRVRIVAGAHPAQARPSRRAAVTRRAREGWFLRYVFLSAVVWLGVTIAGTADDAWGVGQTIVMVLLTPLAAVLMAPMLRLFRNAIFS